MPVRSYSIFPACLIVAKSESSPSAEKTGSRTQGASSLVFPLHSGSPSRYLMTYSAGSPCRVSSPTFPAPGARPRSICYNTLHSSPEWWNGRHSGLKIRSPL